MKKEVIFTSIAISTVLMLSCGQNKGTDNKDTAKKDTVVAVKKEVEIKHDRNYNDCARYLAGMPQDTGSAISKVLTDGYFWKKYSSTSNAEWDKVKTNRLQIMNDWAAKELKKERESNLDLFYPFSGPDILHAITLYPNAKNYYLFALEKCGSLPDMKKIDSASAKNYLSSVNSSLQDIFNKSYFITRKMMNDLSKPNVNGTLPLICVFLARTDNEILDINYYHLNDDGTLMPTKTDSLKGCVKVDFRKKGSANVQTVYYFKTNFADDNIAKNKGMTAYLAKLSTCNTYLKSASYLLHYKFFGTVRDVILKKSVSILEDDTGIPYKYFATKDWKVSIYGKYVKPVKDFSGVFQTDLQKLYTTDSTRKDLPFSLGYHWGDKNQNLLKAEKN